jgi:competence protein ComEA
MHLYLITLALCAALAAPAPAFAFGTNDQEQVSAAKPTTLNLNTATIEQLTRLPGIGPRTAERIIEYRTKVGAFKKIEELMNVKGIGEKSFLKLKPLVSVPQPKTDKIVDKTDA